MSDKLDIPTNPPQGQGTLLKVRTGRGRKISLAEIQASKQKQLDYLNAKQDSRSDD